MDECLDDIHSAPLNFARENNSEVFICSDYELKRKFVRLGSGVNLALTKVLRRYRFGVLLEYDIEVTLLDKTKRTQCEPQRK